MEKTNLLNQLQNYHFAAYDMLLYLDTHPNDKKAFQMFKDLVKKYQALKNEYEQNYGPLSAFASANSNQFDWIESPWPWEKEAN
jgi:spore coat protein JB